MKPEVRLWKTKAKEIIPRFTPLEDSFLFVVDTVFTYNFFYKNGRVRKFDTHNMLKILCDAIAEKSGFDDSLIKFGSWESKHSDVEESVFVNMMQVKT